MNKRIAIGGVLAIMVAFQVSAQQVENDDMYFNSKDREKLKSADSEGSFQTTASVKKREQLPVVVEENINPTESYSARTLNPEYVSRANSAQASEDELNYYIAGYTPTTFDSYSASNTYNPYATNTNNYSNSYANNYSSYGYGTGGYNPYMNPYAGSGLTLSMGYYFGSAWGSGMTYGMGYGWGSPYSYFPSYYSPYYIGGYPLGYACFGGSNESSLNYAKRPSRHSAIVTPTQRLAQNTTTTGTQTRGRQATTEYYVKPSRRPSTNSGWSSFSSSYPQNGSSGFTGTRSRSSYSTPSRNSFDAPSRSSYSPPSRSSGGSNSGGGGGSPSRSRGRN